MLEFLTIMSGLFDEVLHMPAGALKGVGKLRGKVITCWAATRRRQANAKAETDDAHRGKTP